jgi:low temperature requirement protein LtrA
MLFINRYGSNGVAEHLCIFINMYLLYYMGEGTRVQWEESYVRYDVAWGLILVNLAVQYYLKYRASAREAPWESAHIRHQIVLILIQAAIVFVSIPLFPLVHVPLSPLALIFGIVAAALTRDVGDLVAVDFAHLTERVMLFVVFTFGEMIICVAGYFEGGFSFNTVFFSLAAFLVVVGLFLSYEYLYDHIIDREAYASGNRYMILHIFLIAALNDITAALEFMREPGIRAAPKTAFLVVSFLIYFLFLFLLERYAPVRVKGSRRFFGQLAVLGVIFAGLMALCYRNSYVSITLTAVFVYALYLVLLRRGKKIKAEA